MYESWNKHKPVQFADFLQSGVGKLLSWPGVECTTVNLDSKSRDNDLSAMATTSVVLTTLSHAELETN